MSGLQSDPPPARPLPDSALQITPIWLASVLQGAGHEVEIRSIAVSNIGEGLGMLGTILQVVIDYARGEGPRSLIIKLPTRVEQNRQVAIAFNNYQREVRFYQKAAGLTPMRTPRAYLAEIVGDAQFVLVLEDLSHWSAATRSEAALRPRQGIAWTRWRCSMPVSGIE